MPTSTTTGMDDLLADMAALQDSIPPCPTVDPMMAYGQGTGTPPTLNYNVPQSTAFVTYGKQYQYIPYELFKPFTKVAPTNNFFDMMAQMNNQEVQQAYHPNVTVAPLPPLYAQNAPKQTSPVTGSSYRSAQMGGYTGEGGSYQTTSPEPDTTSVVVPPEAGLQQAAFIVVTKLQGVLLTLATSK